MREQPPGTVSPEALADRLGVGVELVTMWAARGHLPPLDPHLVDGALVHLWPAAIEDRARLLLTTEVFVEWAKRDPVAAGRHLNKLPPAVAPPPEGVPVDDGMLVVGAARAPVEPENVAGHRMHTRGDR